MAGDGGAFDALRRGDGLLDAVQVVFARPGLGRYAAGGGDPIDEEGDDLAGADAQLPGDLVDAQFLVEAVVGLFARIGFLDGLGADGVR